MPRYMYRYYDRCTHIVKMLYVGVMMHAICDMCHHAASEFIIMHPSCKVRPDSLQKGQGHVNTGSGVEILIQPV